MATTPSAFQDWVHEQLRAAAHRLKHAFDAGQPAAAVAHSPAASKEPAAGMEGLEAGTGDSADAMQRQAGAGEQPAGDMEEPAAGTQNSPSESEASEAGADASPSRMAGHEAAVEELGGAGTEDWPPAVERQAAAFSGSMAEAVGSREAACVMIAAVGLLPATGALQPNAVRPAAVHEPEAVCLEAVRQEAVHDPEAVCPLAVLQAAVHEPMDVEDGGMFEEAPAAGAQADEETHGEEEGALACSGMDDEEVLHGGFGPHVSPQEAPRPEHRAEAGEVAGPGPLGLTLTEFRNPITSLSSWRAAASQDPPWSLFTSDAQQRQAVEAACAAAAAAREQQVRQGQRCRRYRRLCSTTATTCTSGPCTAPRYLGPVASCRQCGRPSQLAPLSPESAVSEPPAAAWPPDSCKRIACSMRGLRLDLSTGLPLAAAMHAGDAREAAPCPSCSSSSSLAAAAAAAPQGHSPGHGFGHSSVDVVLSEEVLEALAPLVSPLPGPAWALPFRISTRGEPTTAGGPAAAAAPADGSGGTGSRSQGLGPAAGFRGGRGRVVAGPLLRDPGSQRVQQWRRCCLASMRGRCLASAAGGEVQAAGGGEAAGGQQQQQQKVPAPSGCPAPSYEAWSIAGLQVLLSRDSLRSHLPLPPPTAAVAAASSSPGSPAAAGPMAGGRGGTTFFHVTPAKVVASGAYHSDGRRQPPSAHIAVSSLAGPSDAAAWWMACMVPAQGSPGAAPAACSATPGAGNEHGMIMDVLVDAESCRVVGLQTLDRRAAWTVAGEQGFKFYQACDGVASVLGVMCQQAPGDYVLTHAADSSEVKLWQGSAEHGVLAAEVSTARSSASGHFLSASVHPEPDVLDLELVMQRL